MPVLPGLVLLQKQLLLDPGLLRSSAAACLGQCVSGSTWAVLHDSGRHASILQYAQCSPCTKHPCNWLPALCRHTTTANSNIQPWLPNPALFNMTQADEESVEPSEVQIASDPDLDTPPIGKSRIKTVFQTIQSPPSPPRTQQFAARYEGEPDVHGFVWKVCAQPRRLPCVCDVKK